MILTFTFLRISSQISFSFSLSALFSGTFPLVFYLQMLIHACKRCFLLKGQQREMIFCSFDPIYVENLISKIFLALVKKSPG
jgi:hypothetical protein